MFVYEKRLQYPIRIKNTNPRLAKIIISQYGGPHGEIGASLRYLSQRYAMPIPELKAILTDIGTEELSHLEMVGTIVYAAEGKLAPEDIPAILASGNRTLAGPTVPPGGLYLTRLWYEDERLND